MRPARLSPAALLLGSCVAACAVYTDETLKPLNGDVSRAGSDSAGTNAIGTSGGNGGASSSAGGGGSPNARAGSAGAPQTADGGSPQTAGGAPAEKGGDFSGGEASGGAAEPTPGGSTHGGSTSGSGGSMPGNTAGNGGNGTPPTGPTCSDHPIPARSSWVVTAAPDYPAGPPAYLVDNKTTRWTTGKAQTGSEWLQVDFGAVVMLSQINLQQAEAAANDYPRAFTVTVSDTDDNIAGTPVLSGVGKSGVSTTILLPSFATGQFLLIEQTGSSLSWWSAVELEVSCVDPD